MGKGVKTKKIKTVVWTLVSLEWGELGEEDVIFDSSLFLLCTCGVPRRSANPPQFGGGFFKERPVDRRR